MDEKGILRHHVGNVITLLHHIHRSLETQANNNQVRSFPDALDSIIQAQVIVHSHLKGLEAFLFSRKISIRSHLRETEDCFLNSVSGFFGDNRKEDLISMYLREDYMALSLVCATYTMLVAMAKALRAAELSDHLLDYLQEIESLLSQKKQLLPVVAVNEMSRDGKWIELPS
ncbi:MAG: hypothetical protein ACOC0U_04610 [Desulfovibrionales bacterium]